MADATERTALERHLAEGHPNLLGEGHGTMFGRSPLPRDLSPVPTEWLLAVHDANHAAVFAEHGADDWLMRHRHPEHETAGEAP